MPHFVRLRPHVPSLCLCFSHFTFASLTVSILALTLWWGCIHIFSLNDSFPAKEELKEIRHPSVFLWHKVLLNCFTGIITLVSLNPNGEKWASKAVRRLLNVTTVAGGSMGEPGSPLEKAKGTWLHYWLLSSRLKMCNLHQTSMLRR